MGEGYHPLGVWERGRLRAKLISHTRRRPRDDVPIKKGQQLAMYGHGTSMIRCSSGGDNTLLYVNGKFPRQPFSPATDTDGCWVLMEAVIR